MLFVPVVGIALDLAGKVFSNMFYPTQTQIHVELQSREIAERKKQRHHADRGTFTNGMAASDV
jgi:hypothetical protein